MAILRSVFITYFVKALAVHCIVGTCQLWAMSDAKDGVAGKSLLQLRAAIASGNLPEVKELLGMISSSELNQEVSGKSIMDYTLQNVEPELDDAATIELIKSNEAKITKLLFEALSELTLNALPRSTFDAPYFASLLQGIKVDNRNAWESERASNNQKLQQFLTQKIAKVECRRKILEMLIEHGASCNFNPERTHTVYLWRNLAVWLERKEIKEAVIEQLFMSMATCHPDALSKLGDYLIFLTRDSSTNSDQLGLKGLRVIQNMLVKRLVYEAPKGNKENSKFLGSRKLGRDDLIKKMSREQIKSFLKTGIISCELS